VTGSVIELETQPCGIVLLGKSILVGCMDNCIHSYLVKVQHSSGCYALHNAPAVFMKLYLKAYAVCVQLQARSHAQWLKFLPVHYSFVSQGKKNYSIYLPSPISNMEALVMKEPRTVAALLVRTMYLLVVDGLIPLWFL
jgi:hypothetical protein